MVGVVEEYEQVGINVPLKAWGIDPQRRKRKKKDPAALKHFVDILAGEKPELELRGFGVKHYLRIKQKEVGLFVFRRLASMAE